VGHERATRAIASPHATTRKHSQEATLLVSAFFAHILLTTLNLLALVLLARLPSLS
jgi:hypothetical protein